MGNLEGDWVIGALLVGANEVGLLVFGDFEGIREGLPVIGFIDGCFEGISVTGDIEGCVDVGIDVVGSSVPEQVPTSIHFSCHKPNEEAGSKAKPPQS